MNNLNLSGDQKYSFLFSSNSNPFKSFSKYSKLKSSVLHNSSNSKNKNIFSLFSKSSESIPKSKE